MAKSKKNIANIKHPNSRKAQALTKEINRNKTTKNKVKFNNLMKKSLVAEKLEFFKEHLVKDKTGCCPDDLYRFIENVYLPRFDEELKQLEARNAKYKNSNNNSKSTRIEAIKMAKEKEKEELKERGLEVPDVLDQEQFNLLKEWKGDLESLPKFKYKRYKTEELFKMQSEWELRRLGSGQWFFV